MIYIRTIGGRAVKLPWWALALASVATFAIITLIVIFAAGLALVLIPLALVGGLVARFRGFGKGAAKSDDIAKTERQAPRGSHNPVVIETSYEDVTNRR